MYGVIFVWLGMVDFDDVVIVVMEGYGFVILIYGVDFLGLVRVGCYYCCVFDDFDDIFFDVYGMVFMYLLLI